jgi:integrase
MILVAAKAPFIAPLTFLAETGTRVGEAKWLTWKDVDFARRLIHIRPKEGFALSIASLRNAYSYRSA